MVAKTENIDIFETTTDGVKIPSTNSIFAIITSSKKCGN